MTDAGDFIIEGGKLIRNVHEITQSHEGNKNADEHAKPLFHNLNINTLSMLGTIFVTYFEVEGQSLILTIEQTENEVFA